MQTIQLRVWQLVLAVALAALLAGVGLGRYAVPAGKPAGRAVDLGNGVTVYVPKSAEHNIRMRQEESQAQSNLRAAVPAIEAYSADHGGYRGMTLAALRGYDAAIGSFVRIVSAKRSTYCVESTTGKTTYSKNGPGGDLVPRPCPSP